MILQDCNDFVKIEPGSSSETCTASSHDGDQMIDIKVEEVAIPITFKRIKTEHEVSSVSVCPPLGTFHRYPELCTVFLNSICWSVHTKHLHYTEWILKSSLETTSASLYIVAHYVSGVLTPFHLRTCLVITWCYVSQDSNFIVTALRTWIVKNKTTFTLK
jgi:hypothetical protein